MFAIRFINAILYSRTEKNLKQHNEETKMSFNKVMEVLKDKYHFELENNSDGFTDFHGTIKNDNGITFEVEGSIELKDGEFSYSVSLYDVDNDKEYDAEIGSFVNMTENDIEEKIDYILSTDFVTLA